jgi:hypothetical protein
LSRRWLVGIGLVGLLGIAPHAGQAAEATGEKCVVCHGEEAQQLKRSVHAGVGLTCTRCHGGDPNALSKEAAHGAALRSVRAGREAVELCGGCHSDIEAMHRYGLRTDQLTLYRTSRHGQKLFQDGDPNVATCVSCHGPHAVLRVQDPLSSVHKLHLVETCGRCHGDKALMDQYKLPSDIPELYRRSVHGVALLEQRDLASPGCVDCHGSHGATPPRVEELGSVCGQCHSTIQQYFEQGPHASAAQSGAMEECVSCHSNHLVQTPSHEMFLGSGAGHCGSCHNGEGDPPLKTAKSLHDGLTFLSGEIDAIQAELRTAAAEGLFIEDEQGYVNEAQGLLVRARPLTHELSPEALGDLVNRGKAMVAKTRENIDAKSRWLRDRRIFTIGFFGVVLVFVAILFSYRREV